MLTQTKPTLTLFGRFRFDAGDGTDLAPKSAKSQALIALLATSDAGSRGRLWLQKKLWPNSPSEKASVSLRQALSEIRRSLGDHKDLLIADRRSVALPLDQIELAPAKPGEEFLEGIALSAGDHALEEWLRGQRAADTRAVATGGGLLAAPAIPTAPTRSKRPVIVFETRGDAGSDLELVEDIFVDCVSRSLCEMLHVDVHERIVPGLSDNAFVVHVQAYRPESAKVGIRARVNQGPSQALIWSGMTSTQLYGAPPVEDLAIVSLGNQLIDALSDAMTSEYEAPAKDLRDANMLTRLAVRKIFTMRPQALIEADGLLEQAQELGIRALGAAWRAQLRLIQQVELHRDRSDDLPEEARAFCAQALELEPLNSMVLSSVANTRLALDNDVTACLELARRSVSLNPSNPLAWDSLSMAKLYTGEIGEAHALAVRAQRMSAGSPFGYWWDMGRCVTAALTGRAEEALRLAEAAHALSPEFRPPLRYLTALYAAADRSEDAIRVAERLKRLEPDFSFDRMARDKDYPISPLRWSGLLDDDKLIALNS